MEAERALKDAAQKEGIELLAYTFMPDHLHALVECLEGAYLASLMKRFKQTTAFQYKRQAGIQLWQKSYYDHCLRSDEDRNVAAGYIAANPVRKGLVNRWQEYPLTGGSLLQNADL